MTLTFLLVALALEEKPVVCAVMPSHPVKAVAAGVEYAGAKFTFCCAGCPAPFKKDPAKYIKQAATAGNIIGTSLFDPVSGLRVDATKAVASSDFKGVRFHFASAANKTAFDAEPAKFGVVPEKESLVCAVSGETVADYGTSAGYVDHKGVRYYACCAGCIAGLQKNIAELAKGPKVKVTTPKPIMGKNSTPHNHEGGQ